MLPSCDVPTKEVPLANRIELRIRSLNSLKFLIDDPETFVLVSTSTSSPSGPDDANFTEATAQEARPATMSSFILRTEELWLADVPTEDALPPFSSSTSSRSLIDKIFLLEAEGSTDAILSSLLPFSSVLLLEELILTGVELEEGHLYSSTSNSYVFLTDELSFLKIDGQTEAGLSFMFLADEILVAEGVADLQSTRISKESPIGESADDLTTDEALLQPSIEAEGMTEQPLFSLETSTSILERRGQGEIKEHQIRVI